MIPIIRAHSAEIDAGGVTRLSWFGSLARGEAGPEGDVDLLIEADPGARFCLLELAGLRLLDRPVAFAVPSRLRERPRMWHRVRTEAIDVL